MLTIGDKAPDFSLKDENGNNISRSNLEGKKTILYFYPKDDTPGCTKEALEFSEKLALFKDNNTQVIGISKDSVASHKNFCEKYQLKISLLSDPHLKLIKYFGVWQEKRNYSKTYMGIVRSTFLLDEKATIVTSWKNIKVKGHVDKVLLEVMP